MVRKPELPPSLAVQAFHAALLKAGKAPGTVFEGEAWEDAVIVGFEVLHPQTIRQYTRVGRAHRLWEVEAGVGRGNRTKVTLLAGKALDVVVDQAVPVEA